jgi:hypothetical protein
MKVNKDSYTIMNNLRLVYDENGNGIADKDEKVIAEPSGVDDISVAFANKKGSTVYSTNVLHHFIMIADVTYQTPADIPLNTTFSFEADAVEAFDFSDAGTPVVKIEPMPMKFVEYSFEPTIEVFVFTKGPVDPSVPPMSEINKTVEIMQIRTKALKHSNTLHKIKLKAAGKSVYFGDGIKSIKVYNDSNNDGSHMGEDLLATAVISGSSPLVDVNFLPPLNYSENEEKNLLIVASFNIPKDRMAQVEILNNRVTLDKNVDAIGLPLKSKEFWYKCEDGDLSCIVAEDDEKSGCSISTVDDSSINSVIFAIMSLFGLLIFRRNYSAKTK